MKKSPIDTSSLYPVAKLGGEVLLINRDDLSMIGTNDSLSVLSVDVNLRYKKIEEPVELEKHLKFNPWEEITDSERESVIKSVIDTFSSDDIEAKIIEPLNHIISSGRNLISARIVD